MTIWDFFVWFFWFYIAIACIAIFIRVIIDVFRDPTLNGWMKALWVLFLVFFPFLAAFIYLIARGNSMAQRSAAGSRTSTGRDGGLHPLGRGHELRGAARSSSGKKLLDSGAITPAEFESLKAKALAGTA